MADDEDLEAILAADLAALDAEPAGAASSSRDYGVYGSEALTPLEATAQALLAQTSNTRTATAWKEYTAADSSILNSSDGDSPRSSLVPPRSPILAPSTARGGNDSHQQQQRAGSPLKLSSSLSSAASAVGALTNAQLAAQIVSLWAASDAVSHFQQHGEAGAALAADAVRPLLQRPSTRAVPPAVGRPTTPPPSIPPSAALRTSPITVPAAGAGGTAATAFSSSSPSQSPGKGGQHRRDSPTRQHAAGRSGASPTRAHHPASVSPNKSDAASHADRSSSIDGSGPGRPPIRAISPSKAAAAAAGGSSSSSSPSPGRKGGHGSSFASSTAASSSGSPTPAVFTSSSPAPPPVPADLEVDIAALMAAAQARARAEAAAAMALEREAWMAQLEVQKQAERAKAAEERRREEALQAESAALARAAEEAAQARAAAAEAVRLAARARLEQRSSLLLQAHVRGWMARRRVRLADLVAAARAAKAKVDQERREKEESEAAERRKVEEKAAEAERKRLAALRAAEQAAAAAEAQRKAEQMRAEALAREAALEEQRRLAAELERRKREEAARAAAEAEARRLALDRASTSEEDARAATVNVQWRRADVAEAGRRAALAAMAVEEKGSRAVARLFAAEAAARAETRRAARAAAWAAMTREDAASAVLSRLARLEEAFSRPGSREVRVGSSGAQVQGKAMGQRQAQQAWAQRMRQPGQAGTSAPSAFPSSFAFNRPPASVLQAMWRGKKARADPTNPLNRARQQRQHAAAVAAAVRIQSRWRGYRLRAALAWALEAARFEESDPLAGGGRGGGGSIHGDLLEGEEDEADMLALPDLPEHLLQPIRAGPSTGPAPTIPDVWLAPPPLHPRGPSHNAAGAGITTGGGANRAPLASVPSSQAGNLPAYSPMGTPDRKVGDGDGPAGGGMIGAGGASTRPVSAVSGRSSALPSRPDSSASAPQPDSARWELSSVRSGDAESRGTPLRPGTEGTASTRADQDPRAPTAGSIAVRPGQGQGNGGGGAGSAEGGSSGWGVSAATAELMARRRDKMVHGGGRAGHVGAVLPHWSNAVPGNLLAAKPGTQGGAPPALAAAAATSSHGSSFVGRVRGAVRGAATQAWGSSSDPRAAAYARLPSVQDNLPDHLRPGAGRAAGQGGEGTPGMAALLPQAPPQPALAGGGGVGSPKRAARAATTASTAGASPASLGTGMGSQLRPAGTAASYGRPGSSSSSSAGHGGGSGGSVYRSLDPHRDGLMPASAGGGPSPSPSRGGGAPLQSMAVAGHSSGHVSNSTRLRALRAAMDGGAW